MDFEIVIKSKGIKKCCLMISKKLKAVSLVYTKSKLARMVWIWALLPHVSKYMVVIATAEITCTAQWMHITMYPLSQEATFAL